MVIAMLGLSNGFSRAAFGALTIAASSALISCGGEEGLQQWYNQINLVSDTAGAAARVDPALVNPWGLAHGEATPFWVANNGTGTSTVYDGRGAPAPLQVTIPAPEDAPPGQLSTPTGIVFYGGEGFRISAGGREGPSRFLFATEDGTIAGWNRDVSARAAILAVHCPAKSPPCPQENAVYKGLAIGEEGGAARLYATNFSEGTVDVFDEGFERVSVPGGFSDPGIPAGYAPFGIQEIEGQLVVTYAKQSADRREDVKGAGNGYVDAFRMDGTLIRRVASRGVLNSPWGLARSPKGFGPPEGALLVGNFGDGQIHAFDWATGAQCGALLNEKGKALAIEGLWALQPGNGKLAGDANKVYFTAGIRGEAHGLFGALAWVDDP